MKRALNEMTIMGVPSTISLHKVRTCQVTFVCLKLVQAIFNNEKFIQGKEVYTNFLETEEILKVG